MSFVSKPLAVLKEAEQVLVDELGKLWVPWDEKTGSGAVFWHAQAAGALQEAIVNVRTAHQALAVHDTPDAPEVEPATPAPKATKKEKTNA